jgi:hypothetical protein
VSRVTIHEDRQARCIGHVLKYIEQLRPGHLVVVTRIPSAAEIVSPDAHNPGNPAASAILADKPLCASIRKLSLGDLTRSRNIVKRLIGGWEVPIWTYEPPFFVSRYGNWHFRLKQLPRSSIE